MKKSCIYLLSVAMLATFSSCSSESGKTKKITPTATEFTSGELGRYVEFEDSECELSYSEQDGAIPSQTFQLKTTLKKIKSGFEGVDYHDISFTSLFSVAVVQLVDENGAQLVDLDISDQGETALKKLLTGPVDKSAEITFTVVTHNSDDAPKWFKNAAGFTPYLSADISIDSKSSDDTDEAISVVGDDDISSSDDVDESYSSSDSDSYSSSSSSSEDWDAILTSYEQYANKYISVMKKAANGDMSALSEYPALLEKAQEYGDKLSNAQSDMSSSQWARYMKITNKMAQAAM